MAFSAAVCLPRQRLQHTATQIRKPKRKSNSRFLGLSPLERCGLHSMAPSSCPVYALQPTLQDGKKLSKWKPQSSRAQFVGWSPLHASIWASEGHLIHASKMATQCVKKVEGTSTIIQDSGLLNNYDSISLTPKMSNNSMSATLSLNYID